MWAIAVLVFALAVWLVAALRRFVLRVPVFCLDLILLPIQLAQRILWLVYPSLRKPGG